MPKAKKSASKKASVKNERKVQAPRSAVRIEPLKADEKIARLLGLLAIRDVKWKPAQAMMLRGAGFINSEIAEMLDISDNGVSVLIYQAKQGKKQDAYD